MSVEKAPLKSKRRTSAVIKRPGTTPSPKRERKATKGRKGR
jgi:hypothetical protein